MPTTEQHKTPDTIDKFRGKYYFLSNFWMEPFMYAGIEWPSAEHAYQASKTYNAKLRAAIRNCATPGEAKRMGPKHGHPDYPRASVRIRIMRDILYTKFAPGTMLAKNLVATYPATLVEGNTWGDTFWGVDQRSRAGKNNLGVLLMQVRRSLQGDM